MPIIEANAVGRVVITSNIAPMTEVGGESVIYVNPYSVQDINSAFKEIIDNQETRNNLIVLGRKNALRFNVNKIVNDYIKLYSSL
mgnify:FL=1